MWACGIREEVGGVKEIDLDEDEDKSLVDPVDDAVDDEVVEDDNGMKVAPVVSALPNSSQLGWIED